MICTVTYDTATHKIVPIEPTELMINDGEVFASNATLCYRDMIEAAPEYKESENPLDTPLPCDIKVGHGTIGKGCKLSTLVLRMNVLYNLAMKNNSAIAPDPRMNEPWTEEERKDLRTAVAEIFNWKQEPIKAMICRRCGSDRFKEPCKQSGFGCPMVATAHNKESE